MRAAFLTLLPVLAGCLAGLPDLPPPTGDEVTIFIHGYRGGILKTEDPPHDIAWLTPGQAMSGGSMSLARPFPGMHELATFPPLLPAGPLTRFTVVPWLWETDIYLTWLQYGASDLPGFTTFSYDWRRDVRESAQKLGRIVAAIEAKHMGPIKVNLVAHSMGGLVALHWLRHGDADGTLPPTWAGARHVQKVVFVGTPFKGSAGIFDDLQRGTTTERNTALLSREALFTFPSSFQLLPSDGHFFVDAAGGASALDANELNNWIELGWSVFEDGLLKVNEAYRREIASRLRAHEQLYGGLSDVEGEAPPVKALVIVGTGHPTVDRVRVTVSGFDFDTPITADGDAVVTSASAVPPKPLDWKRFESPAEHTALLRDPLVQGEIKRFLTQE